MSQRRDEIMSELGDLMAQQKELFEALPRSIRIGQLWPDAFKDGQTCAPHLVGINDHRGIKPKYPAPYHRVGTITRTFLQREDGETYDVSTEDFFSIITAGP